MAATSPSHDTIQYFKTCSEGSHGLYFRPTSWDRWGQLLEVTVGELLPDQPVPLLKRRLQLSREEALKLWVEKRQQGWQTTTAQWQPPPLSAHG